jgi:hypothetical protein
MNKYFTEIPKALEWIENLMHNGRNFVVTYEGVIIHVQVVDGISGLE